MELSWTVDGRTLIVPLRAWYSYGRRFFNQWKHTLYPNFIKIKLNKVKFEHIFLESSENIFVSNIKHV